MKKLNAENLAKRDLRACYDKEGIFAGRKHFDDYWARDSFYASWGALELGDKNIVKKNLVMFLRFMKFNGQLPLRIGVNPLGQVLKFLGLKMKGESPTYFQDKLGSHPQDQNSLFLITFKKYVEQTKDYKFLQEKYSNLKTVIKWYESQKLGDLIWGGKYATWQDAIKKKGYALYTNVLYYEALNSMSYLTNLVGIKDTIYNKQAKKVKNEINKLFWSKTHYADWHDGKSHNIFSTDGNALAIIFGIANKEKSKLISQKLLEVCTPFGAKTNTPKYEAKETFLPYYLFYMHDYQNEGMHWLWLGCFAAIAIYQVDKKKAKIVLKNISKVIEDYQGVYEVYKENGKPIKRLFYRAETPFAWSSSLFLLAKKIVK